MRAVQLLSVGVIGLLLSACTTLDDFVAAKGSGRHKIYPHPQAEVWALAQESVAAVGLTLVKVDASNNLILAKRSTSAFSYGESVAIFVEGQGEKRSRVEIVVKKTVKASAPAPDWSETIFRYLDSRLTPGSVR